MLANYNTRRTSVVLNPRGRVLGGLGEGEGEGETGGGANAPGEGGNIPGGSGYAEAAAAEAFAASQMADEAALAAAAAALAAGKAQAAKVSSQVSNIAKAFGPAGALVSLFESVTGFFGNLLAGFYNDNKDFKSAYADAASSLEGARAYAGDNKQLQAQITVVQKSLESVKDASIQAAVTQMYQTFAKRNPDPAALVYWSQRFGPTITADEVLAFQQVLYANEPNLRPVAVTAKTAAQSSNNLALPIIAAIAAYFVLGA